MSKLKLKWHKPRNKTPKKDPSHLLGSVDVIAELTDGTIRTVYYNDFNMWRDNDSHRVVEVKKWAYVK